MNKALQRLFKIAQKPKRLVIGLMSGTSLDGLDIGLCRVEDNSISLSEFDTVSYPNSIQENLEKVRSKEIVSLESICALNTEMAHFFGDSINACLKSWRIENQEIDLVCSHGQTIYHAPEREVSSTIQIVDGDHIAQKTGIITISDVRQKHVAVGGEGAPLAQYLDEFLFRHEHKTRVALNLGGIANFTWIPPSSEIQDMISTDVGPANSIINEATQKFFNLPFDEDGKIAMQGTPHSGLVKYLLLEPFFRKPFPKTTGQELFNLNWVEEMMKSHNIELSNTDLVATVTELTVKSVSRALDEFSLNQPFDLIASGGGVRNRAIMHGLERNLPKADFISIEDFGLTSDSKEAVLMAFIGDQILHNEGFLFEGKPVHLGKISLPD